MLYRTVDRDPIGIGRSHEHVRLDGKVSDHREGVVIFDDYVRMRTVDIAPAEVMLR